MFGVFLGNVNTPDSINTMKKDLKQGKAMRNRGFPDGNVAIFLLSVAAVQFLAGNLNEWGRSELISVKKNVRCGGSR